MKMEKIENLKVEKNFFKTEVVSTFEDTDIPKMVLFEFPVTMPEKEDATEKKKSSKHANNDSECKKVSLCLTTIVSYYSVM